MSNILYFKTKKKEDMKQDIYGQVYFKGQTLIVEECNRFYEPETFHQPAEDEVEVYKVTLDGGDVTDFLEELGIMDEFIGEIYTQLISRI